jgi:hypothetical protein
MLLCRISCELTCCVHQPIVGSGQTNLSHLYFSRLSLAMPAKLNFFKTPTSVRLVSVGPCPLPLEYQAATSHTGRQPCRVKSLYMKRFWCWYFETGYGEKLGWFGEIERKLAKLLKTTFTYCSFSYLLYGVNDCLFPTV